MEARLVIWKEHRDGACPCNEKFVSHSSIGVDVGHLFTVGTIVSLKYISGDTQ